jgi:hypothetical protein
MMIELVVVRHGETFANKDHIIQVLTPFFISQTLTFHGSGLWIRNF